MRSAKIVLITSICILAISACGSGLTRMGSNTVDNTDTSQSQASYNGPGAGQSIFTGSCVANNDVINVSGDHQRSYSVTLTNESALNIEVGTYDISYQDNEGNILATVAFSQYNQNLAPGQSAKVDISQSTYTLNFDPLIASKCSISDFWYTLNGLPDSPNTEGFINS